MSKGRFGQHGGQFIPETLMNAVNELETAYEKYICPAARSIMHGIALNIE